MKVRILGTEYEIVKNANEKDYPQLKKCDGYADFSIKKIVVADFDKEENSIDDLEWYKNKVLRHEIIHAFIHESGLAENCEWARNEELTDWIAIQFEKMLSVFMDVGAITSSDCVTKIINEASAKIVLPNIKIPNDLSSTIAKMTEPLKNIGTNINIGGGS